MIVEEKNNGKHSCSILEGKKKIDFIIEGEIESQIDEQYLSSIFDQESYMESLEQALFEYDKFIFARHILSLSGIDKRKQVEAWLPGIFFFYNKYTLSMNRHQTYDLFDIDNFFKFCKTRPMVPESKEYRFSFCELERNEKLDTLVIGTWITNHLTYDEMNLDFQKYF